jgi:hypothetical protein
MARVTQFGIEPALGLNAPSSYATGEATATSTTMGTDTTPVVTEAYVARVFIDCNSSLTGIALLNGSAVAGNVTAYLCDSNGNQLAVSASTAQSGTAAYQQIPFTSAIKVRGPGVYFVVVTFDSVSARFRSWPLGNFGAGKVTGLTYGSISGKITPPTGFTANLGPIASTY